MIEATTAEIVEALAIRWLAQHQCGMHLQEGDLEALPPDIANAAMQWACDRHERLEHGLLMARYLLAYYGDDWCEVQLVVMLDDALLRAESVEVA